jgi:hypothetical protein
MYHIGPFFFTGEQTQVYSKSEGISTHGNLREKSQYGTITMWTNTNLQNTQLLCGEEGGALKNEAYLMDVQ